MTFDLTWLDPAIWALFAFSAGLLTLGAPAGRRGIRLAGATLLLAGVAALAATLAFPALLPDGSSIVHPDGSTGDPRVLSALLATLAAIAATLPGWRTEGGKAMAGVGAAVPGLVAGGLFGSLAFMAGLHPPMALATIGLGGVAAGTALAFLLRRAPGGAGMPLLAVGVAALAIAGVISVHGPRAVGFAVTEDAPADTLGLGVSLLRVDAPANNLRVMSVSLHGAHDSLLVRPRLEGRAGKPWRSIAGGSWLSGPIAVPLSLGEQRSHAHEIQWIGKGDSLKFGDATLRFTAFRIEHTDTLRMFADLDVTTAAGTERVSPGVVAGQHGEVPFAANAKGLGPIVVARFDPDNHRVGLVLPTTPGIATKHRLVLDLRLRPALRWAWLGALVAALGWVLALALPGEPGPRKA